MTQLEMITSTLASRERQLLDVALDELDVRDARLARIGPRELEHLVCHVQPDRLAARSDPPGRDQHVRAAARPEVENGLALVQIGDSGRHAAAERRLHGGVSCAADVGLRIEGSAEHLPAGLVRERDLRAAAGRLGGLGATAARCLLVSRGGSRGGRVALAHGITDLRHLSHSETSFSVSGTT